MKPNIKQLAEKINKLSNEDLNELLKEIRYYDQDDTTISMQDKIFNDLFEYLKKDKEIKEYLDDYNSLDRSRVENYEDYWFIVLDWYNYLDSSWGRYDNEMIEKIEEKAKEFLSQVAGYDNPYFYISTTAIEL